MKKLTFKSRPPVMKKRMTAIAGAIVVTVGLIAGPAVAANADASATYTYSSVLRASSYWNASTDTMSTTDHYNDGWGSRIKWNLEGNTTNSQLDNIKGAGQTESQGLWVLPSWRFRVQACSINNGTQVGCGGWSGFSGV
ncbi:hypothetical protein [Microbacterium ureisolvens]|uniref:Secreted protein n=1 Tax=Microbacterium ureisolvens TaxID=2781186 RepID=A0ABS7I3L3_9MICO|nr:hypothetical protein [Microbacterium ureisolvens]MBW9111300.1 hypothetical protein [Microbacterium ureisolvens]